MANTIPIIRIKYAWLLAGQASVVMNEKYGDGTSLRSDEEYEQIAEKYNQWWSPNSTEILHGICDILNLEFRQSIIDIYIAPWFRPISDPMVIGPAFRSKDYLVITIAHELIHRLITDNNTLQYDHKFLDEWRQAYGDEHMKNTLIHIPVHAVLKSLYLDVLNRPDLLELDIHSVDENPPYKAAWKYVNENDYKEIIAKIISPKSK
jgi:hypothetical protein